MKKVFIIACAVALCGFDLYAGTPGSLADIGTGAKDEVAGFIKSLKWVFAVLAIVIPVATAGFAWNKIAEKEEASNGAQSEPKMMKGAKVVGALFAGFAVMYIIFGAMNVALLGGVFSEGWGKFVSTFWVDVFQ